MYNGKYVILAEWVCDDVPIVFPSYLNHADVVHRLGFEKKDVVSAGFVSLGRRTVKEERKVLCTGDSTTLGVKSRGEADEKILNKIFETDY